MKLVTQLLVLCLLNTTSTHGAEPDTKIIYGSGNAEIVMSQWDKKIRSWTDIEYRNEEKKFQLYQLTQKTSNPYLAMDTSSGQVSSNQKYLVLQRIEFGVLFDDKNNSQPTEKTYCDIIEFTSGCVLLTRPSEYCSGIWSNEKWLTDNGQATTPKLETLNPSVIIDNIKTLDKNKKAVSIKEYMFMGAESYLACHPPKKHVQGINDLAFFLSEGGDNYNAMKLYRALEKVSPSRVVLKLNIADALWVDGKLNEAEKYYADYILLMKNTGRSHLVPEYVKNRLPKPSR